MFGPLDGDDSARGDHPERTRQEGSFELAERPWVLAFAAIGLESVDEALQSERLVDADASSVSAP
jgi:hypothetical protein